MRIADRYQVALIVLGVVSAILIAVFFSFELFPEYRTYQDDYVDLERFRSSYTGEAPPEFKFGVKQILIEREDLGPPLMDRCTTCHVALQFQHFSPTKVKEDINGNVVTDKDGKAVLVPNEDYVWGRLDKKIEELRDEKTNQELISKGQEALVKGRLAEAKSYESLKTTKVGHNTYDVTKVLAMHPLMGKEVRPFQYHPIEEYGCTSCHNGNGKAITTEKAHGPVFDGQYEIEYEGPAPEFTEHDPANDPRFASVFNSKPGHNLLFQTTPIYVGALIQAKCVQCHQSSKQALIGVKETATSLANKKTEKNKNLQQSFIDDKKTLLTSLAIRKSLKDNGFSKTLATLSKQSEDYTLPAKDLIGAKAQKLFLEKIAKDGHGNDTDLANQAIAALNEQLIFLMGSKESADQADAKLSSNKEKEDQILTKFIEENNQANHNGSIFQKATALKLDEDLLKHVKNTQASFETSVKDPKAMAAIASDVDELTKTYHQGQDLFISQACYACHRISGLSRGGVGPELSREGYSYPWFVKESIVWPQADLKTSTMPNYKLDHQVVEPLVTFLLGQTGKNKSVSEVSYKTSLLEWEGGKKLPWEEPITPAQMTDVRFGMTVFATEGCSACHRLKGFESNVGFTIEKGSKEKVPFEKLNKERNWFKALIPEFATGSDIVQALEKNRSEIDQRIVNDVRKDSLLEEIEVKHPGQVEAHYTPFIFAKRAKNNYYSSLIEKEKDQQKKKKLEEEWKAWQDRVHRVLMIYIQEYGLGRIIGPRPNWSGIYRSDEWLMEHFRNPSGHVPRSIMPIFPFDESKFYSLTHMLDVVGKKNRNELREVWQHEGFNPLDAFVVMCAQCHGDYLQGNGPVSDWIYPAPKNLRNADFLRNMTRERVIFSITHGVQGTPMPPWGEASKDKQDGDGIPVLNKFEIEHLTDWLFTSLSGGTVIRQSADVPKWQYEPHDFLKELKKEGGSKEIDKQLEQAKQAEEAGKTTNPKDKLYKDKEPTPPNRNNPIRDEVKPKDEEKKLSLLLTHPEISQYFASLDPQVNSREIKDVSTVDPEISKYFDAIKNPPNYPDPYSYYFKKSLYTPRNIESGRQFFEVNCAECHGREADGMGARAGNMYDAKPRMLINLDWQNMRDDLRLVRSIKYGVPGTSMTPWGDFTSALQRMQLVLFIRSLAEHSKKRELIYTEIYKVFDTQEFIIERARVEDYKHLDTLEKNAEELAKNESKLRVEALNGKVKSEEATLAYKQLLEAQEKVNQQKNRDQIFQELRLELKKEHEAYLNLGAYLTNMEDDSAYVNFFVQAVSLSEKRYSLSKENLIYVMKPETENQIKEITQNAMKKVEKDISSIKKERIPLEGQIDSHEKKVELEKLKNKETSLDKLRQKWLAAFSEAARSRVRQAEIYSKIKKQD